MNCRRGRPRKCGQDSRGDSRSYWLGEVFFTGGYGWGIQLVVNEFKNICLGREEDIIPVLKGQKTIPEDYPARQRIVLTHILEDMGGKDAGATETRGSRSIRSRPIGVVRHRQKNAGRPTARKRFPIR
jgi:hypothetical protein